MILWQSEKMPLNIPIALLPILYIYTNVKKTSDPDFEKVAQKTVLYFNNPNWLQFQLNLQPDVDSMSEVVEKDKAEPENQENLLQIKETPGSVTEAESLRLKPKEVFQSTVSDNPSMEPAPEVNNETQQEPFSPSKQEKKEELISPESTENEAKIEKESFAGDQSSLEFEPLHTVDY